MPLTCPATAPPPTPDPSQPRPPASESVGTTDLFAVPAAGGMYALTPTRPAPGPLLGYEPYADPTRPPFVRFRFAGAVPPVIPVGPLTLADCLQWFLAAAGSGDRMDLATYPAKAARLLAEADRPLIRRPAAA